MELLVPLKSQCGKPLYAQIYTYIKGEIKKGNLKASAKLPSTRLLSENLKVSRSTAQMAYDQLLSEGYIEAVPYKGYYVCRIEELCEGVQKKSTVLSVKEAEEEPIYQVNFSPWGIDLGHFPYQIWKKLFKNTLVDNKKEMFLTGPAQGELALREAVRDYLHSARGVNCREAQIIIGAGSEYLLMLLQQILGPDRIIAMENPTYKQAYHVFRSFGCKICPIEMDALGMSAEKLSQSVASVAYVMPSHQYPTGTVMPVKRRQQLLSWARSSENRYLIEDDYDSEFRYRGRPIPALQGMDVSERVIYLGTFSKSIAPAIRVSFMVLPGPLLEIYRARYSFYTSTVSRIDQNILHQFLVDGYYERHLNRMRAVYKAKHDALLAALKLLERDFRIGGEYSGLHILLTHGRGVSEQFLLEKAAMAGVKVYGLSSCFIGGVNRTDSSTVLLGYANLSEQEIVTGIRLLKDAWKELDD